MQTCLCHRLTAFGMFVRHHSDGHEVVVRTPVTPPREAVVRKVRHTIHDLRDWCERAVTGKLHLPPQRLRDVGPSDFEATGREFLAYFKELVALQPTARVLEIGCGVGRMAIPLTGHLHGGTYVGLDIVPESIRWCQHAITRRFPNFQFALADLHNQRYNPKGRLRDEDYRFPYADRSYDFIFLTSVFTHVLPAGVANYLREMARMLADDGQVFMSFFLLNDEQRALAHQGRNTIAFKYANGCYRARDAQVPEGGLAYDEAFVLSLLHASGFVMQQPILYGDWSGREDGLSFQDIIIASRIQRSEGA